MSRIVIVSNRVAVPRPGEIGTQGGLAAAVDSAVGTRGGLWFGWSGRVCEGEPAAPEVTQRGNVTYVTTDLARDAYERYYKGFANSTLWPLLHDRHDLMHHSRDDAAGYHQVNQAFAAALAERLAPDDVIWVHDYHLFPLGRALRAAGCRQPIGFFLHVPWPAPETVAALPEHRDLVQAMFAYDLIGFQTERDVANFRSVVTAALDGGVAADGTVHARGQAVATSAYPVSIDTAQIKHFAAEADGDDAPRRLRETLDDRAIMIGVDRLDYTKGLVDRFRAFAALLRDNPKGAGAPICLQIGRPSRQDIPVYRELGDQVAKQAGHVNSVHGRLDWTPLTYLNQPFSRRTLAALMRQARVGTVTPYRDGMNLVAKEYVAAQDPEDPGVLVLSEFAGAAAELDGAVLVNPHDVDGMAEGMNTALAMPRGERRERWRHMMARLERHDVHAWCAQFLDALTGTAARA